MMGIITKLIIFHQLAMHFFIPARKRREEGTMPRWQKQRQPRRENNSDAAGSRGNEEFSRIRCEICNNFAVFAVFCSGMSSHVGGVFVRTAAFFSVGRAEIVVFADIIVLLTCGAGPRSSPAWSRLLARMKMLEYNIPPLVSRLFFHRNYRGWLTLLFSAWTDINTFIQSYQYVSVDDLASQHAEI